MVPTDKIIDYHGIYQIDISRFDSLIQNQAQFPEAFNARVKKIVEDNHIAKWREGQQFSMLKKVLAGMDPEAVPNYQFFKQLVDQTSKVELHIDQALERFGGIDFFAVQELVNCILGIEKERTDDDLPDLTEKEKRVSYELMKHHGLLTTEKVWFGEEGGTVFVYDPGTVIAQRLNDCPEIQTLTIGCGSATKMNRASCYYARDEEHQQPAITADISAFIGPDVVCDMHNPQLWKGIPDGRFEVIQDHTHGSYLFDDPNAPQTLREIFRVLRHGGVLSLKEGRCHSKNRVELLVQQGFMLIECDQNESDEVVRVLTAQKPM